jgi:hypothetical protein
MPLNTMQTNDELTLSIPLLKVETNLGNPGNGDYKFPNHIFGSQLTETWGLYC